MADETQIEHSSEEELESVVPATEGVANDVENAGIEVLPDHEMKGTEAPKAVGAAASAGSSGKSAMALFSSPAQIAPNETSTRAEVSLQAEFQRKAFHSTIRHDLLAHEKKSAWVIGARCRIGSFPQQKRGRVE